MAGDIQEDTDYESDPEEVKLSLKMRRREASDDDDGDEVRDREASSAMDETGDFEGQSDGEGGAADYEVDHLEGEEYYDEQEDDYEEYEESETGVPSGGGRNSGKADDMAGDVVAAKAVGETGEDHESIGKDEGQGEEEKKENEPFAVPTSGAFYMHDDRFRDNASGRHGRAFRGRRLWESKDDRKWGHDKFEEMNMQGRHFLEGKRSSRGYYQGRGKTRGVGYRQGNMMTSYGGNNNQKMAHKDVKGRGPRRYQPLMKSKNEMFPPQKKQLAKTRENTTHAGSRRIIASTSNPNVEQAVPAKTVASSLSSASPPFYPCGSSNKETALMHKKEVPAGHYNRNIRPSAVDYDCSMSPSNSSMRGKSVIDSVGIDKLQIIDSASPAPAKPLINVHSPSSASSSAAPQIPQSSVQGRSVALTGSAIFQPTQTNDHVKKVLPPATHASHRYPLQNQGQPSLQASGQQLGQHPLGASQDSSLPKAARKEKSTVHGAERGSFVYGDAQAMGLGGNTGAVLGDQNLPAFFPVMQFGGQHPSGVGVPAVGMAFPGYVAQPDGLGNSEMTWLPVLAGAAGALGATYCPPYIAVDGGYQPRSTGPASGVATPSKDANLGQPDNEPKPQRRFEAANDEFSQRQNKPRRYSEMSFSQ